MVHHRRKLVVQKIVVQGSAGLLIEQKLFAHAVADRHRHAAVHLRRRQRRVDEVAAVVHVHDVLDRDFAHRNVHLDLRERAAERICVVLDRKRRLRRDVLAVLRIVLCGHGELGKRNQHLAVTFANHIAVFDLHIVFGLPRQLVRVGEDLLFQKLRGLPDRESGHVRLPRCVRA